MKKWRAISLAVLSISIAATARPAGRPLRFEELAKVQRVGGFGVSPDGKWVAYAVGTPVVLENRTKSAIWLASSAGGAPRRLTSGEKRDSDPAFSPDGRRVAFLSNRDGSSQIWLVDLAGGAESPPSKATSFPTEVNGFKWSPDGKWFLVTSDVFPDCTDAACLERRAKEREKSPTKARIVERLLFRHWDSWKEGLRTHIWKLPVTGGAGVDLTPGDHDAPPFDVGGALDFNVSPDGKDFVYASNTDPVEALSTNSDLWLVPFSGGGSPRNLTASNRAFDGTPKFSPDGKWIAYRSQKRPGFESDLFRLSLLDRASGTTRELTAGFDDWVDDFEWAPDSKSLFFLATRRGRGAIYRVGIDGRSPKEVWRGGTPSQIAVSPDGSEVFVSASTLSRPAEILAVRASSASPANARTVARANDALLSEIELGQVSERWTKSADGRDLHAWLVKPPGFDPSRKYPAVFLIHGGPQGAWNDAWSFRWNPQVFAAYGYVVYAPNPRGSTGFGQEFVDQISRDWGGRVYDDLMRQADDLESLPFVDRARIGAAGASYGGYMIAWILGHTDRFKALVCHDGVVETRSMALETEELWFPIWEFGGWPWDSEFYEKWNPMLFADKFRTPTLVVTSEKDFRVPFGQGLQLFTALQVRGVPSKILTFPDEGHWVLKPGNSRVWHALVMDWLGTYLGGARPEKEALDAVYSITK